MYLNNYYFGITDKFCNNHFKITDKLCNISWLTLIIKEEISKTCSQFIGKTNITENLMTELKYVVKKRLHQLGITTETIHYEYVNDTININVKFYPSDNI